MNKFQTFEEFLTTQSVQIPIFSFVLNLIITAILAIVLGGVYIKYGRSLSNRKQFAQQFILLAMTTMVVISIVKSSLALSLGLVGALSIVRFRSAIKEPEELTYLFLSIAIGLGMGADQRLITIAALLIIIILLFTISMIRKTSDNESNLYLSILSQNSSINLPEILTILEKHCKSVDLKRFDDEQDKTEFSFLVKIEEAETLQEIRDSLRSANLSLKIGFIDSKVEG